MLSLKNITKDYVAGDTTVKALRGIDVRFRESEFVSILGPSGCGKTTLLNIIGGLDKYTSGDLVINGRSTREYKDKDWDAYRNHSIGFVFQTYNLIPHQSVLSNVELALTISGVSKAERKARAMSVLTKVGLADQMNKRPNQMSGGQMQRVAIARALVNDPDILLADEPTGALDSETSLSIMELLKEIASDKLVIMVTHNPELAERYSTRIVRLLDGRITGDSNPYDGAGFVAPRADGKKRPSMSFATAFTLSLNNLLTKKTRTLLTAFAGSIGIIGIALIMSLSNGIQLYIDRVQEDTLSSYPITIQAQSVDLSSMIGSISSAGAENSEKKQHENDAVYSNVILYDLMNSLTSVDANENNLRAFKEWLEKPDCPLTEYSSAIQYGYDAKYDIYTMAKDGSIVKADVVELLENLMGRMYGGDYSSYFSTMGNMYSNYDVWYEMLGGAAGEPVSDTVLSQYDVIYGAWPQSYDEVVLIVDKNNEISDLVLYALGLKTDAEMTEAITAGMSFEQVEAEVESWSYEEICSHTFKLISPAEYYYFDGVTGSYVDASGMDGVLGRLFADPSVGTELKIVGVVRQNEDAVSGMMQSGAIGFTSALTDHVIDEAAQTAIVAAQLADPSIDIFTGLPFRESGSMTNADRAAAVEDYMATLTDAEKAKLYVTGISLAPEGYADSAAEKAVQEMSREDIENMLSQGYAAQSGTDAETIKAQLSGMSDKTLKSYVKEALSAQIETQYAAGMSAQLSGLSPHYLLEMKETTPLSAYQYNYLYRNALPSASAASTLEKNLKALGYVDFDNPDSISIYAVSFEDKDAVSAAIEGYNDSVLNEDDEISYTDYVALLMSSITTIINAISYVLIAFVAISLVVSSIMIGIITYISVLERTKEIGVLRAIGASKKDVSNVFNAETVIEGFAAGLIGILVTLLLIIPINAIVQSLTGIPSLKAVLPLGGAVGLIIISILLTFIAGLIPSGFAARRDPVEALRTE